MVHRTKASTNVTITRPWQLAFLAVLGLSAVFWTIFFIISTRLNHVRVGASTYLFQIVNMLYPFLFVGASYVFARKRVRGLVPRLFWAAFLSLLAVVLSQIVSLLTNYLYYNVLHRNNVDGKGLWSAFGTEWVTMGIVFVLYCLTLLLISKRKRT